jgi:MoxR-like ATPase
MFEGRLELSSLTNSINAIRDEIKKIIVGQEKMVDLLIASILADGHVLIEGNPGLAKTLTARILAKSISTQFSRIQFTPDLMPSDVLGTSIFNFKDSEFEFKKGPIFSNIILVDEINRAPAKTQAALFEVMEERQVTMDGTTYKMKAPFMIVATQNPIEMEGTYRLPEAQMDRFLFKISVDYPNLVDEVEILTNFHEMNNKNDISNIKAVVKAKALFENQQLVSKIQVEEKLLKYIVELVQKTRKSKDIMIGASPRAAQGILSSAKAIAGMNGRDFVIPDDILYVATAVLRHRIIITPEKEMEGATIDEVIEALIKGIEIPR